MDDPLHFKSGPEETSIPSLVSGLLTSQDVSELSECDKRDKLLKSYGLSDFEIQLCNDAVKGNVYLKSVHKNMESSVLQSMLNEINEKIRHYENSNLTSFQDENKHKKAEQTLIHPINKLDELKNDLFGHLESDELPSEKKRRKFIRRMTRKLNRPISLPEPKTENRKTEKLNKNTFSDFVKVDDTQQKIEIREKPLKSKWDLRDADISESVTIPQSKNYLERKRTIGCSSNSLYTIKNNKIVRLEPKNDNTLKYEVTDIKLPINKAEEKLLEGTKLDITDIKNIPKFENYSPGVPSKVLYIKNLSNNIKEEDVQGLFESYENYINVRLMVGKMRGQAFVTFKDIDSATLALREKNGIIMKGKPIIIQYGKK